MTNYVICTQVNNNQRVESSSQIRLSSTFLSFQENLCNNAHYSRISQKLQIKTETFIKKIINYQFKKKDILQLPLKALIIAPFFWFYHAYILLVNMNEHSNMRHQRGRRPSFLSSSHYFLLQKCHDSSKNEFHCYLFLKDSPMIFISL